MANKPIDGCFRSCTHCGGGPIWLSPSRTARTTRTFCGPVCKAEASLTGTPEKKKAYMTVYRSENAVQIAIQVRGHRDELGDTFKAANKSYCKKRYHKNPGPTNDDAKRRYQADPAGWYQRVAARAKVRKETDPVGERAKIAARARRRRQSDIRVAISGRMSNRIWTALKRKAGKKKSWLLSVDYTVEQLIGRLNQTMPEGYTWDDFLRGALHIDHIRPVVSFEFWSEECPGFREC